MLILGCERAPAPDVTDPARAKPAITPASPPIVATPNPSVLQRIAVVGASATVGFGATVPVDSSFGEMNQPITLADVVRATLVRPERSEVTVHGDLFFFSDPMTHGPRLMDEALATDPTLVVAIDFLFWFGYGDNAPGGGRIERDADRLALLELGLAELERVACPLLIGDYPDMAAAVGLMLSAGQVPTPQTRATLNDRVREWATTRPHVRIVPLAAFLDEARAGTAVSIGRHRWPPASPFLQPDHLHPTSAGLLALTQLLVVELRRPPFGLSEEFLDDRSSAVLERLRGAFGP
ncbi:MAG: hypothetical protein KJO43_06375 [Phycisphaerae bacterium]|nr:hypothetical protein [Phycisphaerae bacterium]